MSRFSLIFSLIYIAYIYNQAKAVHNRRLQLSTSFSSLNPSIYPTTISTTIPTTIPSASLSLSPISPTHVNNTNAYFCATFDPTVAAGANGYFAMKIESGVAKYAYDIDLTNFEDAGTCSLTTNGLKYHIHSYWTNTSASSLAGSVNCGSTYLGGHYDPNLACSSSSQYISTSCESLGRVSSTGYSYTCQPSIYNQGDFSECEVGDLSGKFGIVYPTNDTLSFSNNLLVDYYPPYIANYQSTIKNSIMWSSIIFHCGTSAAPRLLCGQLSTTDTNACLSAFSEFNAIPTLLPTSLPNAIPTSQPMTDDNVDPTIETETVGIVVSTIVGVIIGVIMSQILTYFIVLRQAKAAMIARQRIDQDSEVQNSMHALRNF